MLVRHNKSSMWVGKLVPALGIDNQLVSRPYSPSETIRRSLCGSLLLNPGTKKADTNLLTVDPSQLATTIGNAPRREYEEKLLASCFVYRCLDKKFSARL